MKKSDLAILIVDDDASLRTSLQAAVTRAGFSVLTATNASEVEKFLKMKPVHGLVIDCMLPGVPGVELAVRVRKSFQFQGPLILMSGIFRDKGFAADALAKTGATAFFLKPFDVREILKIFERELAAQIDRPKLNLHSLLSRPYASHRDRQKALDEIESIRGYDLPLLIGILMEGKSSGYLNIVSEKHDIFGITFAGGKIAKVDTEGSQQTIEQILERNGFVTAQDIAELRKARPKGDIINQLIGEGLLSPHAPQAVLPQQIFRDLAQFVRNEAMSVNFVPDRKIDSAEGIIDLLEWSRHLENVIEQSLPVEWIKKFYEVWMDHPVLVGPNGRPDSGVYESILVKRVWPSRDVFDGEPTLAELMAKAGVDPALVWQAVHFLAVRGAIVFNENKRGIDLVAVEKRVQLLLEKVRNQSPEEVFQFFGCSERLNPAEVTKVFRDFAVENHPDRLPPQASEKLKKASHDVFSAVSRAHDILVNPDAREKYFSEKKHKEAQSQIRAEQLLADAARRLEFGKPLEALPLIDEAEGIWASDGGKILLIWARLKGPADQRGDPKQYLEDLSELGLAVKDKPEYHFVRGLCHLALHLNAEAIKDFNRSLQKRNNFMAARRELLAMKGSPGESKGGGLGSSLTSDISSVISNFFKKNR